MNRFKKRGIVSEYLPWLLISLAVLAIIIIFVMLLKINGSHGVQRVYWVRGTYTTFEDYLTRIESSPQY